MITTYTDAGTPIIDLTEEEYDAFLDREVDRLMGISVDEFVRLVQAGDIDWDHPEAFHVAGLVDLGRPSLRHVASRRRSPTTPTASCIAPSPMHHSAWSHRRAARSALHLATARVALELVVRHLIAEGVCDPSTMTGLTSSTRRWQGFEERRRAT